MNILGDRFDYYYRIKRQNKLINKLKESAKINDTQIMEPLLSQILK